MTLESSISSIQTTNLGWKLSKLQQRVSEWLELRGKKLSESIGELPFPSGLDTDLVTTLIKVIFWLIVAGLLIWITLKLQRFLRHFFKQRKKQAKPQRGRVNTSSVSTAAWIKQAQKLQQEGNYREACQCLYQAMLQQLHDRDIISHEASRTDGEYWQLIENLNQPQPYQQLLQIHQELCFANIPASFSLLETCWHAYWEIEKT